MPSSPDSPRKRGRRTLVLGGVAAAAAGTAAYRRFKAASARTADTDTSTISPDEHRTMLLWDDLEKPVHRLVGTKDGAQLAVWDIGDKSAPTVVLPHCWGCTHDIWILVARRLLENGHRVVLYDQRGHGVSSRGTNPLTIEGLGQDLAAVLEACDVHDAVLAGHSMGGMTVMSLGTYYPAVMKERARALVLVSTAAKQITNGRSFPAAQQVIASVVGSQSVSRLMQSPKGHRYVRNVFGTDPVLAHMEMTSRLFGECQGPVRGGYLTAMIGMNVIEGISAIDLPTTVMVGSRDRLTLPASSDHIVAAIPGARLVTLKGRGHMLPLEDPDAVTDEIIRAIKG